MNFSVNANIPISNLTKSESILKKHLTEISKLDVVNLCEKKTTKINKLVKKKKKKNQEIVLIGIGGSNLGTKAICSVLNKKITFVDTVDSDDIKQTLDYLKIKKDILLIVISKSGTTTETIANFEIFLSFLKKKFPKNYQKKIVIISNPSSPLIKRAVKEKYDFLEMPESIGGRYSVLSEVGLFPLLIVGVNIKKLLEGARQMKKSCLLSSLEKNPSSMSASVLFNSKKPIHETFIFSKRFENLGKWYRQLLAESIGKEKDITGKIKNVGITPIISIGSTDLHSIAQLDLGGPKNKITTFLTLNKVSKVLVPKGKYKGSLEKIMSAIIEGTKIAFKKDKRDFLNISINPDETDLGKFIQFKIMEIIFLSKLLNVNAFDQPAVEKYKEETKRLLK